MFVIEFFFFKLSENFRFRYQYKVTITFFVSLYTLRCDSYS